MSSMSISIHAPYAGGDGCYDQLKLAAAKISIHAPYAGGDLHCTNVAASRCISIHAPYAGGDTL